MKNKVTLTNNVSHLTLIVCVLLLTSCSNTEEVVFVGSPCEHFNCADATVLQLTDQYFPPSYEPFINDSRKFGSAYAEFLGFKYNIPLHVFEQTIKGEEFGEFLKTGRGGASVYYPSCHHEYKKSKFNSKRRIIKGVYNKSVTTMSYGCGKTHYMESLPTYILGGRNSSATSISDNKNGVTWYGQSMGESGGLNFSKISTRLNRPSSGRYYSDIQRKRISSWEASNYVRNQVSLTLRNKGFYTNFMHWQDYYTNSKGDTIEGMKVIDSLFIAMRGGIGKGTTSKVDYNQAVEYLYAKESIDTIVLVRTNNDHFELHFELQKLYAIDYDAIDTPVSISIPRAVFDGIKCQNIQITDKIVGAFAEESSIYLNVLVNWSKDQNRIPIKIGKSKQIAARFEPILFQPKGGRNLKTNKKGKFVLFRRSLEGEAYEMEIIDRSKKFGINYELPSFEEGYRYFCGAISEDGESSILEL